MNCRAAHVCIVNASRCNADEIVGSAMATRSFFLVNYSAGRVMHESERLAFAIDVACGWFVTDQILKKRFKMALFVEVVYSAVHSVRRA